MLAEFDLVAHVGVADMPRARRFYGDVLGLPVVDEDPFAVTVGVHGRLLRLAAVGTPTPARYSVLAWRVDDIEGVVDGLVVRGVEFDLVAHVGVADMARARLFYGDVLGLPVIGQDPFAVTVAVHGRSLRLAAVGTPVPAPYSVLAWRVDDIDTVVDGLVGRGVEFARYEGLEQDGRGIWTAPGGTRVAWFLDPDGNNLSLAQFAQ